MKLHYKVIGEGKPLLILHGLFGSSDNWISIARKLSKNRKVYLIDQRNHGNSPHADEFSYAIMSQDLKEFVEGHHISSFDLMGHSMGGKTAMLFATLFSTYIDKLIIVDIGPKQYPVHHDIIIQGLKSIDLANLNSRNEADAALAAYVPLPAIRQFLLKNLKRTSEGFKWKINLAILDKKIVEVGKPLPPNALFVKPTLFIRGGMSNYILQEDMQLIQVHFPNSTLVTVKSASHWVHAEKPVEFLKKITQFLGL